MFTFPVDLIPYLNFVLIIWFLITVAVGYKKGLLLQIIDLTGTIVALFAAWLFAPVMVKVYQFVKPMGSGLVTVEQVITHKTNELIWFLILFIIARILLLFVTPLASFISKMPLIKQVNSAIGGIFSIVLFAFKLLILTFFLSFPIIKNGQEIIENTWLKNYMNLTSPLYEKFDKEIFRNEALQSVISDQRLNEEQIINMSDWLKKHGFSENEIKEYLNKHE